MRSLLSTAAAGTAAVGPGLGSHALSPFPASLCAPPAVQQQLGYHNFVWALIQVREQQKKYPRAQDSAGMRSAEQTT